MAPRTALICDPDQDEKTAAARALRRCTRNSKMKAKNTTPVLSSTVWQCLPQELIEHILTMLPLVDLVRLSGTCRSWLEAILSPATPSILTWRQAPSPAASTTAVGNMPWFLCGYELNKQAAAASPGGGGRQCRWVAFNPSMDTWNWIPSPAALADYAPGDGILENEVVVSPLGGKGGLLCWELFSGRRRDMRRSEPLLMSKPFTPFSRLLPHDLFPAVQHDIYGIQGWRMARMEQRKAACMDDDHPLLLLLHFTTDEINVETFDLRTQSVQQELHIRNPRLNINHHFESFYYHHSTARLAFFVRRSNTWRWLEEWILFYDGVSKSERISMPVVSAGRPSKREFRFHMVQLEEDLLVVSLELRWPTQASAASATADNGVNYEHLADAAGSTSPSTVAQLFKLDFANFKWLHVEGSALDIKLRALPRKSDCIASSSQLLLMADAHMYLYNYSTNVWRRIPACKGTGASKKRVRISMLGCSFDASLDGNLYLPPPSVPGQSSKAILDSLKPILIHLYQRLPASIDESSITKADTETTLDLLEAALIQLYQRIQIAAYAPLHLPLKEDQIHLLGKSNVNNTNPVQETNMVQAEADSTNTILDSLKVSLMQLYQRITLAVYSDSLPAAADHEAPSPDGPQN